MSAESVIPLRFSTTSEARADLTRALLYLDEFGGDVSDRFEAQFDAVCAALCERVAHEIADNGEPFDTLNPEASVHWSQPIYRESLRTSKRQGRRSSVGLWYIYYALRDTTGDGNADTLRVYAIRHSAARPLSLEPVDLQDAEEI